VPGPWADGPLRAAEGNRLDRAAFVARAVEVFGLIASDSASTVVGLIGPWAPWRSGLTTLSGAVALTVIWVACGK